MYWFTSSRQSVSVEDHAWEVQTCLSWKHCTVLCPTFDWLELLILTVREYGKWRASGSLGGRGSRFADQLAVSDTGYNMDSAALKITSYNTTFKVGRKGKGTVPENSSFGFVISFPGNFLGDSSLHLPDWSCVTGSSLAVCCEVGKAIIWMGVIDTDYFESYSGIGEEDTFPEV